MNIHLKCICFVCKSFKCVLLHLKCCSQKYKIVLPFNVCVGSLFTKGGLFEIWHTFATMNEKKNTLMKYVCGCERVFKRERERERERERKREEVVLLNEEKCRNNFKTKEKLKPDILICFLFKLNYWIISQIKITLLFTISVVSK